MIRLLFLVLLAAFAQASLIKDVHIFETSDRSLSIEEIKDSSKFKRTTLPIVRHTDKIAFVRITFDKSKLDNKTYQVELDNEFNTMSIEKNIPHINIYKNQLIELSKNNFIETLYIKINNVDQYMNFNANIYEANEYAALQLMLTKLYGVAYGIIFAAFLYYFAFYLFNKEKVYIYYALTQLSMLSILIFLAYRETDNDRLLMDIIFFSFFIFSNLFTKNFLNTKVNCPRIDKILTIIIFIYIADMMLGWSFGYYPIADNMPLSTLLIFYIIAGILTYQKGYKPALFYLIAWGMVTFSFLFIEAQFYYSDEDLWIRPNYIIHIITPLESLILAFALSYKMRLLEEEKLQQQEFLTHQSKLASMGEMIGNIAHQWRQPLTHLSYIMMNIKTAYEHQKLTPEYFDKKNKEATQQLEFMSHTIDDFRDFFKVTKQKEAFYLIDSIQEVLSLLDGSLKAKAINTSLNSSSTVEISSFKGEFLQVLFNIINNAKDALTKQQTHNPHIDIDVLQTNQNAIITITDNAGGIEPSIMEKIFEPYFTTKDKGLGIGLYMSKMIVEKKLMGKLTVRNHKEGACFTIQIPLH